MKDLTYHGPHEILVIYACLSIGRASLRFLYYLPAMALQI